MKLFNRQSLKILVIFYILFYGVQNRAKCDVKLMETFSLKGLHYSVASPMHICPDVQDRCCTNMDQLRILKLWNSQGRVTTRMHSANFFQTFIGTLDYLEKIVPELDESNIITSFIKHRWVPYIKHYCGQTTEIEVDEEEAISRLIPGDQKIQPWDRIVPVPEQDRKIMEQIDRISTHQYLRIVAHFTPKWKEHFDEMENYYYSEVDLKSIRVQELFVNGVNFQHEKNYFLYFLQIAANAVIDVYQNTAKYYEGKVKNEKLVSYQETFLQQYKNFMLEAESFMEAYNRLDDPIKRFTELHVFAHVCKQNLATIFEGLVIRERALYLGLNEFEKDRQKQFEDALKREEIKSNYRASVDQTGFKNMISDVRDEHQQYIKEYQNGGKGSLNATTPDEFFTDQFKLQEKRHNLKLPYQKMRKLGTKILRQQMKLQNIPSKRRLRRKKKKNKKKRRRRRFRRTKRANFVQPDEKLDFPSVALQYIIKFRKKSITYALNVQYHKDSFWKNIIQSFVHTRYDFQPKQIKVTLPGQFDIGRLGRRRNTRRVYFFDQKQLEYIGKQYRIPTNKFRPVEHPKRLKTWLNSKKKFKRLERYHAGQRFQPFTVNDRLFGVKLIKLPFKSMVPNDFECQVKGRHFYRSLVIQNTQKVEFCYRTIRNLKEESIDILSQELKKQITPNINILDLKKTIYCAVCDPDMQYLFHAPKKIIIYEEKFCYDMINMHHDYLTFMHVTIIEFLYNVFQTISCIKETGNIKQLPFDTILDQKIRRLQFTKNCLENSEGDDFMRYCYNVCQQINMLGFSDFWDGDANLIQEIFAQIYNFGQEMEIEPIPEVEQIEYKIPLPVMRDSFQKDHSRGQGYSKKEKEEQKAQQNLMKIEAEQKHIIEKNESAAGQKTIKPVQSGDRLEERDKQDTLMYKQLCQKCPAGDAGINCRVKFCRQPTPCDRCPEGPDGILCREKYCEFYKPFLDRHKSQNFDTARENQPQEFDADELIQLAPKTVEIQKRFSKVSSRQLKKDNNKITSENTDSKQDNNTNEQNLQIDSNTKEGRILALDDDDQSLKKEIYKKKLPLYDVQSYRNFFTANRAALNPLKISRSVKFNQMTPKELLTRQIDQFKNNSLQPEVIKEFLNIDRKEVKEFNKDININFDPVVSSAKKHIPKSKYILKKLKRLRYIKNLKKTTVELELHRPYKFKYKLKKMPPYSFILDDIGENSNDPASKIMLGKVVRIFKDPSDPRDAVKPYKPEARDKKNSDVKIANQINLNI